MMYTPNSRYRNIDCYWVAAVPKLKPKSRQGLHRPGGTLAAERVAGELLKPCAEENKITLPFFTRLPVLV